MTTSDLLGLLCMLSFYLTAPQHPASSLTAPGDGQNQWRLIKRACIIFSLGQIHLSALWDSAAPLLLWVPFVSCTPHSSPTHTHAHTYTHTHTHILPSSHVCDVPCVYTMNQSHWCVSRECLFSIGLHSHGALLWESSAEGWAPSSACCLPACLPACAHTPNC